MALTSQQRTSPCLRGRLPDPDALSVEAVMNVALEEARRAECERERADGIVRSTDATNTAWQDWLHGRR